MIPMVDLPAQYASIKKEVDAAVADVLKSGRYALGPEVEAFEREFANFCGTRHAVGVNSGTSALYLSLLSCGIGPGDEVLTVPFTFIATVAAIRATGARVRFVDIEPRSFTMDVAALEQAVTEKSKAIIPVHLFGQPANMDGVLAVAKRHRLNVIEDACQAHGATYKDRCVGSLGDVGCFSFYPTKNLGAYGEGGMLVTNSQERAELVRQLRNWGQSEKYTHLLLGGNYRLDSIQSAVLRVKLRHLPTWNVVRRKIAAQYDTLLTNSGLELPHAMPNTTHVYHLYAVRHPHRDELRADLVSRGVQVEVHYPTPIHLQAAYQKELGYQAGAFPVSEKASREELSLPIYPELGSISVEKIAATVMTSVASMSDHT